MKCNIPYIANASISETEKDRLELIHLDTFNKAKLSGLFREIDGKLQTIKSKYAEATAFIGKINSEYGPVSKLSSIGNGNTVLSVNVLPLNEEKQLALLQKSGTETSVSSPKTISLIKEFLKRIDVDIETLQAISVNGVKQNANGAALLTQNLIQVVNGKEDVALTEEAMHFAVAIIKQKNPELYNQLLKEINNYNLLNQVFVDYSKVYIKDGKPDVVKIKEEAIAKVLTEIVINKNEGLNEKSENLAKAQTWWTKILEFLKGLFLKSGFDIAAMKIISGEEIGTVEDIREKETFFQLDRQQKLYDDLVTKSSQIEKKDEEYYINGKKISRRVTSLVKSWYERRFKDNELTKTEYQKSVDDLKAEKGTKGHYDLEHAFSVFVDDNGYLRETPLDDGYYVSQISPNNKELYNILKSNLKERLLSFPPGTRFLSEITVYDPKRDLAGTIDFLAISPDGKVSVLDWKFMDLNTSRYEDVPWYKINAWRQQMEQYKLILEKTYSIKPEDFQQTRMIPIQAIYSEGNKKENILPRLEKVRIGDVNVKNITEDYLLPVGLEEESTGNTEINNLLEKLNALYKKISDKSVPPSEKAKKSEQLNSLFKAIRQLQMKKNVEPLIIQAKILNKNIERLIENYNTNWKGKDPKDIDDAIIENFSEELQTAEHALTFYTNLDTQLEFIVEGDQLKELEEVAKNARKIQGNIEKIDREFNSEIVAKKEGVTNILSPEKVIKGFAKWFSSTSTIQMKSIETLYKKVNRILAYASMDTLSETKKLQGLKEKYDEWAKNKGLISSNYFDVIKKKGENELIDEFNPEFYNELKTKIKEKDFKWIKDNIDIEAHKKEIERARNEEIERIKNKVRIGEEEENEADINKEIFKAKELFNINTITSPGWLLYNIVKKSPKRDKWETNEWKELHKTDNKPALDFYDYIKSRNEYYQSINYINKTEARVFLPFVRKRLMEKLVSLENPKLSEEFLRAISVDEGDVGYGQIDPLTGEPINTIPKYFTNKLKEDISEDLFRNMALFNEAAIRYKYLDSIDSSLQGLMSLERNKKAIATSFFGKTVYKDGKLQYSPDNNENTKLYEDMLKAIVYGQKFIQSETFDQLLGSFGNFGEKVNKKLGIKLLPENLEGRQVSVNKSINQLNNAFQLNALGLNPLSALSNFMGGSFQSIINAGTYFTKSDVISTELWMAGGKMLGGEDSKKMIGALEYFLPLTESYNKEVAKTLALSKLSQERIQEFLMILMRKSDWFVQTVNFYTFLRNSIIQDGKIVNAREYVRSLPEFKEMYEGTSKDREKRKEDFEKKVKSLLEEKSVLKLSKIENNEFVIPGVDRKDNSVIELRRKVQQLNNDALGNLSEDNVRKINLMILGKSFMLFKNWIPRLVDVRTGNLKYNNASDAYEWGRMRMVFRLLAQDTLKSLSSLQSSIRGNDEKWVEQMKQLYDAKKHEYEQDTGRELTLSRSDFMDLVNKNIKNQALDAIFMLTLLSLFWALKANEPDEDEDPRVRNSYKFLLRATDKIKDELAYFYNPTSFTSLVSSGIFPSMAYINNFKKLVVNFGVENYALAVGDEKLEKDTKVIKYLMKSFPIMNQAQGFLPIFYPELAKELGIKPLSQARPLGL